MGTMIGAATGILLFATFGLIPAFRFGSYLALFILHKTTGRPVETTVGARVFIISTALLSILCGAAFFVVIGALLGSVFLL